MKIIGITGGIGSGKSVVLDLLKEQYHAYVVETDTLAHRLMEPDGNLYPEIISAFGRDILAADGLIDRKKLGSIVFKDEEQLALLNRIVHPGVKDYIFSDMDEKRKEGKISLYVIESAILIETGLGDICDECWYVYVEKEERIRRLILGRGGTKEKWLEVMARQQSDAFYRDKCEHTVNNSGNVENTANIVKELLFSTI